jgi:hypothetical protein
MDDEDMDEDEESSYLNGTDANEGQGTNRRQRRGTGMYDAWNRKVKQLRLVIFGKFKNNLFYIVKQN